MICVEIIAIPGTTEKIESTLIKRTSLTVVKNFIMLIIWIIGIWRLIRPLFRVLNSGLFTPCDLSDGYQRLRLLNCQERSILEQGCWLEGLDIVLALLGEGMKQREIFFRGTWSHSFIVAACISVRNFAVTSLNDNGQRFMKRAQNDELVGPLPL